MSSFVYSLSVCPCCRGFFGGLHWEAFLSLPAAVADCAAVVAEMVRVMFAKIRDLAEYLEALRSSNLFLCIRSPAVLSLVLVFT